MRIRNYSRRLVALAVLFAATQSVAALRPLEPVTLQPGDTLEQIIDWDIPEGVRIQIRIKSAPDNAKLTVGEKGRLVVKWQTGPDLLDETPITIQAHNVDTQALINSQLLTVRKQRTEQVVNTQPQLAPVKPLQRPTLNLAPVAGQIISTGRTVSVHFYSKSSDSSLPELSMDRLPRGATLEKNSLGVYTFFWQTSDRDQGEHVFRVTATHPADSSVWMSRDITIVVGDPSRAKTVPL